MEDDTHRSDPPGITPEPETPAVEPEKELPPPPTAEEMEKAEGLIRQANLAKIRGDKSLFERLIQEAAQVAPGSSRVQEALGDAFVERRQLKHAREAFEVAVQLDPNNASAERKFGEAVLSMQLALDPMFATIAPDDSFASGKAGLILSFMIPGMGQIVAEETKKGSIMLGGWLIGLVSAFAIPQGMAGLSSLFNSQGPAFKPIVLLPLTVSAACWLWSIGDSGSRNKRFEKRVVIRPIPPVDKDFEL